MEGQAPRTASPKLDNNLLGSRSRHHRLSVPCTHTRQPTACTRIFLPAGGRHGAEGFRATNAAARTSYGTAMSHRRTGGADCGAAAAGPQWQRPLRWCSFLLAAGRGFLGAGGHTDGARRTLADDVGVEHPSTTTAAFFSSPSGRVVVAAVRIGESWPDDSSSSNSSPIELKRSSARGVINAGLVAFGARGAGKKKRGGAARVALT
jgi:hypothetical protein